MIILPGINKIIPFFIFLVCFGTILKAQPSFTISSSLCSGDTVGLTANVGTFPATSFNWSSTPVGALFSAPNSSVTLVSFPASGNFAVWLSISVGGSTAYTSQPVTINALPSVTLTSATPSLCAGESATLNASGALSYVWTPTLGLYFFSNTMAHVSLNATTSYSVAGTNSLGCTGHASFTLDVKNYPSLVITPGSTSVCGGNSTTITAGGATNYTWTSTTFTGAVYQPSLTAAAGAYSVVGANGICRDSSSVVIALSPALALAISASRNTICINDGDSLEPINMKASGATYYSWKPFDPARMTFSLGATTVVNPTISTCYTLTGSTAACTSTAAICVNVTTCTSLEENKEVSVSIFPNPVLDKLYIHNESQGKLTIRILSVTGELKQQWSWQSSVNNTRELSLENFPAGIYLVHLDLPGEVHRIVRVVKL